MHLIVGRLAQVHASQAGAHAASGKQGTGCFEQVSAAVSHGRLLMLCVRF
jgi:hypothetical protein